jgi:hypothetical protein
MTTLDAKRLALLPEEARGLCRFACTRMVHSYKPVLMKIFLRRLPELVFPFAEVAEEFVGFYEDRAGRGLAVERVGCGFLADGVLDCGVALPVAYGVIRNVFDRHHHCAAVSCGACLLQPKASWADISRHASSMAALMDVAIESFYRDIAARGEAVYARTRDHSPATASQLVFCVPCSDDDQAVLRLRSEDNCADEHWGA